MAKAQSKLLPSESIDSGDNEQTGYWIVYYSLPLSSYCMSIIAILEIAGLPKKKKKMDVPVTIVTIEREMVSKGYSPNSLSVYFN